ncbi:MAG: ZIP family metal transporter [Chloroflexi bacterium]|nr:ZIP family metal transporter [Chloroflexota bacterium]
MNLSQPKTKTQFTARTLALAIIPLILLAAIIAIFLATNAGLQTSASVPPGTLAFERVVLRPEQIIFSVINSGNSEITIAQVAVDNAIWESKIEPRATLQRLERATITLNYPWVENERHEIKVITSDGISFKREIALAVETPQPSPQMFLSFALIGLYVGILPIALGMLWYPFLRKIGKRGMDFVLALTVGLLIFLGVETLSEALEIGGRVPKPFQGTGLVTIGVVVTFLAIIAIGQLNRGRARDDASQKLYLAYLIALGIGLHNLGEGLAIGASYAVGELALGAFLVIGFIIQNLTEGFGIVVPIIRVRPALKHFAALGLLAGAPAIAGTWLGGFLYSDVFAALFFAIGAGAIFQVVYEIAKLLGKESGTSAWNALNVAGLFTGLAIVYVTGLLV